MQEFAHGKGQELAATDELLDRLGDIDGTVVTFDALHARQEGMEKIVVKKNADYLIQVKNNTPVLVDSIERAFSRKRNQLQTAGSFDCEHGRLDSRDLEMVPLSPVETGWPHTNVACRLERDRQLLRRGELVAHTHEVSYYVASFPVTAREPEQVLQLIRGHWGIENELHHPKDRSMDEDRCRASESGIGRVISCIRGLVAQLSRRTKESLGVLRCRFARKPHLLINLLFSPSIADWEKRCTPYKPI